MRVWYPGPSVSPSVGIEAQNHAFLGRIVPGWNHLEDGPELRAALIAGLVRSAEPIVVCGNRLADRVVTPPRGRAAKKES